MRISLPKGELFEAIEVLCKGWEIALPEGFVFHDKDNNPRTNIRTKWWQEDDKSYQALAIGVKEITAVRRLEQGSQTKNHYSSVTIG